MNIKTFIYLVIRRLKKLNNKKSLDDIVLTRISCLGRDVLNIKYENYKYINKSNIQKGRVDMMMNWLEGEERPNSKIVKKHLLRKDIFPHIKQQERNDWTREKNIEFLLMDSYSELTDQKFTHKEKGWSFLSHYSDIKQTVEFNKLFSCEGLLLIEDLEKSYRDFFRWFGNKFPGKFVFFIHFSTKFDDRQIFKKRSKEILKIMEKLELENEFIHNIIVEDNKITQNDGEKFPYHFSNKTFKEFVNKWNQYD